MAQAKNAIRTTTMNGFSLQPPRLCVTASKTGSAVFPETASSGRRSANVTAIEVSITVNATNT